MIFDIAGAIETPRGRRSLDKTAKPVQPASKAVIPSHLVNNPMAEV